jgi:hypothetical protein
MQTKTTILSIFLFSLISTQELFCQEFGGTELMPIQKKHSIGFQVNPFIDESFWHNISTIELSDFLWVSSFRYLYELESVRHLKLGGETSLHFYQSDFANYTFLSFGPLVRYDVFIIKRVAFGAEFSPYMTHERLKFNNQNEQQIPINEDVSETRFAYYIAPLISLKSKNSRWTYDFSWKFSGEEIIDNRKHVPSFKINYHF